MRERDAWGALREAAKVRDVLPLRMWNGRAKEDIGVLLASATRTGASAKR